MNMTSCSMAFFSPSSVDTSLYVYIRDGKWARMNASVDAYCHMTEIDAATDDVVETHAMVYIGLE